MAIRHIIPSRLALLPLVAALIAASAVAFAGPSAHAVEPGKVAPGVAAGVTGVELAQYWRRDRDDRYDRDRDYHRRYRDRDHDRYRERDRDYRRYRDHRHDRYRYDYDRHERWRTKRHPRRPHWLGRRLPMRGPFLVINNYWDYYLPPPPYGHYYVRVDDDIFLVMEATRTIVDVFILLELLGR